jgi:hypothetical protein
MKQLNVKVLRPFLIKGEPVKVGAKLTFDAPLAYELLHAQKVEVVPDAKPAGQKPSAGEKE